jgi:molybdopterin-binding protein
MDISFQPLIEFQPKQPTWTSQDLYQTKIPNNIIVGEATAGKKISSISFDSNSTMNTLFLGSAVASAVGGRFQSGFCNIFTQSIPSGTTIANVDFKFCLQNIMTSGITNSRISNLQDSILGGLIIDSQLGPINSITVSRNILRGKLTKINSSFIYARIDDSYMMLLDSCYIGSKSTARILSNVDLLQVSSEDFESSTYIYSSTYAKKVMGTTGASHVLYIDNNGTVQTDLTTN